MSAGAVVLDQEREAVGQDFGRYRLPQSFRRRDAAVRGVVAQPERGDCARPHHGEEHPRPTHGGAVCMECACRARF